MDGQVHNTILFNLSPPLKNIIRIIKIIKDDPGLKVIPTFIFSSSIYEHDLKECYRNQVNCYTIKPDESEELISIMEAFEKIWFGYAQLP